MIVPGCDGCVLNDREWQVCRHPGAEAASGGKPNLFPRYPETDEEIDDDNFETLPTPGWCPLRTAPLMIALEQENPS